MATRTLARTTSPTARDGIRLIVTFMTASVMVLQLMFAPSMTMRMSDVAGALAPFATLCTAGFQGQSGDSKNAPNVPAGPDDHATCVMCQCLCAPPAILSGPSSFLTVVTASRPITWSPFKLPQRTLSFHLYFSRAPPFFG